HHRTGGRWSVYDGLAIDHKGHTVVVLKSKTLRGTWCPRDLRVTDELPNSWIERGGTRYINNETIERKRARGQPLGYCPGRKARRAEINTGRGEGNVSIASSACRRAVATCGESQTCRSCCGTAAGNGLGCYPTV